MICFILEAKTAEAKPQLFFLSENFLAQKKSMSIINMDSFGIILIDS
ncbi:hypothetical protein PEPS_23770 [Persicobacter psychrovividus]|uniref:Uncharacterized protein n=1 Tax=Persicobacter psychrovividus TaxID=387638 RepID=A0ABN6LAY4_9BACT|nr:hypothetical protein PEPS_23770 [Persicobacter psychrovividus]